TTTTRSRDATRFLRGTSSAPEARSVCSACSSCWGGCGAVSFARGRYVDAVAAYRSTTSLELFWPGGRARALHARGEHVDCGGYFPADRRVLREVSPSSGQQRNWSARSQHHGRRSHLDRGSTDPVHDSFLLGRENLPVPGAAASQFT